MSKKNNSNAVQARSAAKKAVILNTHRKSSAPKIIAFVAIILIAAGTWAFYNFKTDTRTASTKNTDTLEASTKNVVPKPFVAETITYPVNLFSDGKARHFDYAVSEDSTVRYFVLKSADGVIRAAFDACDVCWPAGKGYYQNGDVMVCRNCGRQFASVLVNEVKGGCNPAPLDRQVSGDQVIIRVEDIMAGQQYFNFKGKV